MDITSRGRSSHSPRVLVYRKHVRIFATLFHYLQIQLVFILAVSLIWEIYETSFLGEGNFYFSIGFSIYFSVIRFIHLKLLLPLADSKIQVFPDHIHVSKQGHEYIIPFSDVAKIEATLSSWFILIMKNGKKYYFPAVLERPDYILDAIMKAEPLIMERDRYQKLRKNLIRADHKFSRLYDKLSWMGFLKLVCFPLFLLSLIYFKQSSSFIIHFPFAYFFKLALMSLGLFIGLQTLGSYLINENMDRRLAETGTKIRDLIFEKRINNITYASFLVILLLAFGVFDLNAFGFRFLTGKTSYLNLKTDRLILDGRYNCLNCTYSLTKGDIIITDKGLVGRIVALPKEEVVLNPLDKKGRHLAAQASSEKVPHEQVAFLTKGGTVTKLVPLREIKGKFLVP